MAFKVRGVEVVGTLDGSPVQLSRNLISVSASNRNRDIAPGMFVVRASSGHGGGADGCRGANDTANGGSGAREIISLVAKVLNTLGGDLDVPYLGTSTAGYVQVYENPQNLIFRITEDGDSERMVAADKSVAMVDGSVGNTSTTTTPYPNPYPTDMLDSSTGHATIGQHAFDVIMPDPDPRNAILSSDTDTVRVWYVKASGGAFWEGF